MGQDNIPEPNAPGFEALQISPHTIEHVLRQVLALAGVLGVSAEDIPLKEPR